MSTDTTIPPARLKARYEDEVRPKLQEQFGYSSPMQHPRIEKITLNMGVGEAKQNSKVLDEAVEQLAIIAGQRPAITRARKSIAQFKLREDMPIGAKVTLRGARMWEFYLITSELSFRYFKHMVFQIQLAKAVDTLPLQRDYMVDVERALINSEARR